MAENEEKRKPNVIRCETARLEIRRNFYNVRAAKRWNEIPDEVKEQQSVNAFKNAYDKWANKQHTESVTTPESQS